MIKIYNYPKDSIEKILIKSKLEHSLVQQSVRNIIKEIKEKGNQALFDYTEQFDKIKLNEETIKISEEEINDAYGKVSKEQLIALKNAKRNVYEYHIKHKSTDNIIENENCKTGFIIRPIEVAGIYVPGGTAAYPSSVLMCALPAKAAGVKKIIMCSPKIENPLTIVAANECGVNEIYKVGGAQAIAAMSYGTTCIPKVDIIAGPGNIYVAMAKREVYGQVKIDMIAGPSEILVVADNQAKPNIIAADLLSQAEHDKLAKSILITDNKNIANKVQQEIEIQIDKLPRKDIAKYSIDNNGAIIVVENLNEAIKISNMVAPEHLELCLQQPEVYIDEIENAGAIFVGYNSPEPLGDYFAGPSHVLPTSGTAKYFEVLNADTFTKKISLISYSEKKLKEVGHDIICLAESEGFSAHANSIKKRLGEEK